jgi:hypothetical protein
MKNGKGSSKHRQSENYAVGFRLCYRKTEGKLREYVHPRKAFNDVRP